MAAASEVDAGPRIGLEAEGERVQAPLAGLFDESTSIGLVGVDVAGTVTRFNRGAEQIYGVCAAEILGRGIDVLPRVPEEVAARIRQLEEEYGRPVVGLDVHVLRARERGSDEQTWTIPRAGEPRLVEVLVSPVRAEGGEIAGYVEIVRDVTAVHVVREAHDRFRGALLGSIDSITICDAIRDADGRVVDFEIVEANEGTAALMRRPREALLGARISTLGDPAEIGSFIRRYAEVVATGERLDEEHGLFGAVIPWVRWLRHQVVRVGDGVAVTTRDISQRKLAEERLRDSEERLDLALAAAGDELWDWDLGSGRVLCLRGRPREATALSAQEIEQQVHPDDRAEFCASVQESMSGESPMMRCEYRSRGEDGSYRWMLGRGRIVARDDAGRPSRLICTRTDITDRRRQEDALREAVASAEAASRAKSDFLAHVSHEIRTPMNGILGMVELALRDDPAPRHRERLGVVHDSARSLLAVINDLLDVAKIEAGKLELAPEAFDLRAELQRTVEAQRPRAQEQGLGLGVTVGDGVPRRIVGDAARLRQVLVNLIGNAIKFTEQGEVSFETSLVWAGEERVRLRFAVRDTGIGIAPERVAAIFDPFVQADASTTRRFGGTGLGLTIASQLVHLMGGAIAVESVPGVGSTFSFEVEFPLAGAAPGEATSAGTRVGATRSLRVLLAEDNRINQLVAVEILRRAGHEVHVVDDGRAAVAAARGERFDLVLMDVQMPELDGWEATRAIRRLPDRELGRVPIIAMTARATESDRLRSRECGMNGFISKPLQIADLEAALAAIGRHAGVITRAAVDDWSAVLGRVGGSRPLLARLIGMACEELPELVAALRAHAAGDPEELRRAAHRASGTAAMFSASASVALARELEDGAWSLPPEERAAQVARTAEELERLAAELAEKLPHLSEAPGT